MRQFLDEVHPAGALRQSERLLAKFKQLGFGAVCAAVSHHARDDVLAEDVVWHAYGRGFAHRGMSRQRLVDLARGDLVAAAIEISLLRPRINR